uniref:uncharacterized protein LOC122584825 n=1 Tax=Erigeron canadensis TaxID=72917 RepID=UPI001CB9673C|nr:uncharacterized protein LOC122584825 [Erigeron canadensis]
MEVKKVYCRKNKRQVDVDHIPKCYQLPRTTPSSKPTTQFDFPASSFQELEPRSRKEIESSVSVLCSEMSNGTIRGANDPSSSASTEPQYRRRKTLLNGMVSLVTDAKFYGQKALVQPCSSRKDEDKDDTLDLTPNRSQLTESSEMLHYKKPPKSCKESYASAKGVDDANHHDQLSDRGDSSSSSRVGTGWTGRARSKRERKRKVHFDEVTCPLYTSRKVRRFKIMRSLGLAAPVGSPFISLQ